MTPVTLERLVQELEILKKEMDVGALRHGEYDQRLARIIGELRDRKIDAGAKPTIVPLAVLCSFQQRRFVEGRKLSVPCALTGCSCNDIDTCTRHTDSAFIASISRRAGKFRETIGISRMGGSRVEFIWESKE